MPAAPTADRLLDSDEFTSSRLGLQWSWNHNPDAARWSLAQRPGFLRIEANQARHLVGARNTLTQILQGPRTRITARLEHPAIVPVHDAGIGSNGAPFYVMERVVGIHAVNAFPPGYADEPEQRRAVGEGLIDVLADLGHDMRAAILVHQQDLVSLGQHPHHPERDSTATSLPPTSCSPSAAT